MTLMARNGRGCDASDVDEVGAYHEVSRPGTAYPMMSISTADDLAVVHLFRAPDSCFLLGGDRVVDDRASRSFRILEIDVPFSGAFICTATRAQAVVDAFSRGTEPDELGSWTLL
jgi:hypothetical protein